MHPLFFCAQNQDTRNYLEVNDKKYYDALFRFSTKESATHAIVAVHNADVNGAPVKCSWGKESGDPNNAQGAQVI